MMMYNILVVCLPPDRLLRSSVPRHSPSRGHHMEGPRLTAESLWVYLTSFNNVGPLLVWLYIIASLITLLHFIFDLWRK